MLVMLQPCHSDLSNLLHIIYYRDLLIATREYGAIVLRNLMPKLVKTTQVYSVTSTTRVMIVRPTMEIAIAVKKKDQIHEKSLLFLHHQLCLNSYYHLRMMKGTKRTTSVNIIQFKSMIITGLLILALQWHHHQIMIAIKTYTI